MKSKINKIRLTLEYWKANLRIVLLSRFSRKSGLNTTKRAQPIIVTLTSYPKRFSFIHLTIESLLHQTIKPDGIILWLSSEETSLKTLPKSLLNLQQRGLAIKFIEGNLKSYKKLVYAIKEYPEALLITCDDDVIYKNNVIASLLEAYNNNPDCIVANRCVLLERGGNDHLKPYNTLKIATTHLPSFSLLPTGVGGVLYPPGFLHPDVTNQELFMALAPTADDVWFKAMGMMMNRKVLLAKRKTDPAQHIHNSQKDALWRVNVETGANDKQIENVFSYYDLFKLIE